MKRIIVALTMLTLGILTGCSSGPGEDAAPSGTSACTKATAQDLQQVLITDSRFQADCVKVATGVAFYFVNNDTALHTVSTATDAPEQFDAELPRENSTYSHTFATAGRYVVTGKGVSEPLTLIVT